MATTSSPVASKPNHTIPEQTPDGSSLSLEDQCAASRLLQVAAMDMDPKLVRQLVESFNALADEVQNLTDRKTILEHKLRYAHEQYQSLADKYAPCAPDVAETIAKLQIPPTPTSANFVPLPSRHQSDSSQAQLALFVREGKKVAQQLQAMAIASKASASSRETTPTRMTSDLSTALEKDFTVEGKKGQLQCPFSAMQTNNADGAEQGVDDPTPHHSTDPICAAMLEETTSSATPNAAASATKCPIRYMDKHSPEEIAHYVETHKHELPRSHEVCLRRNQKNEEQIRKLDAKYGNIVSMIADLSHLHAPMLPSAAQNTEVDQEDRVSDRRVSDWAQNVSVSATEGLMGDTKDDDEASTDDSDRDPERTGHFDRPLKEVRVGESPSRPWGISVPIPPPYAPVDRPVSPPAPVRMPSPAPADTLKAPAARPGKCPFDHTKMRLDGPGLSEFPKMPEPTSPAPPPATEKPAASQPFTTTPLKHPQPVPPHSPPPSHQPAFINLPGTSTAKEGPAGVTVPQMVFNGPVFIGYPMESAIEFMKHFQSQQQR